MNMPVPPVISPSQPPSEGPARGADGATDNGSSFSNVLTQQKAGQATHPKGTTAQPRADRHAKPATEDTPTDPDATLSLILDTAALPLMQAVVSVQSTTAHTPTEARTAVHGAARLSAAPAGLHEAAGEPASAEAGETTDPTSRPPARAGLPEAFSAFRGAGDPAQGLPRPNVPNATTARATDTRDATTLLPGTGRLAAAPGQRPAGLSATEPTVRSAAAQDSGPAATLLPDTVVATTSPVFAPAMGQSAPGAQPLTLAVATPLGQPRWAQDFSHQVLGLARAGLAGTHTVQLHVNPPELGPVHITLHVSDSTAQAAFVSPHAHVREAIQNALPGLEQQLAQAGLSLGQANVGDQQPGQQHFGSPAQAGTQGAALQAANGPSDTAAVTDVPRPRATRSPDALVDTFA